MAARMESPAPLIILIGWCALPVGYRVGNEAWLWLLGGCTLPSPPGEETLGFDDGRGLYGGEKPSESPCMTFQLRGPYQVLPLAKRAQKGKDDVNMHDVAGPGIMMIGV